MSNIFVTGANGFIGSNLVKKLLKRGYPVKVLIRNEKHKLQFQKIGAEVIVGNIEHRALKEKLKGIDIIYHIAALRQTDLTWNEYCKSNIETTKILLNLAEEIKIKKFIYLSTVHVHGFMKNLPIEEVSPYNPKTLYAKSKMLAEEEVLNKKNKFDYAIVRSALVYGPGDRNQFLIKLNDLIKKNCALVPGNGKNRINLIYIDDLVNALVSISSKKTNNQILILAGEKAITINTLIKIISRIRKIKPVIIHIPLFLLRLMAYALKVPSIIFKKELLLSNQRIDIIAKDRDFSIQKAKRLINFYPKISYIQGIKKTIEWYGRI